MSEILTVGHSNHPLPVFIALLHSAQIQRLVDIRTLPGSRAHPHFNSEALALSLPAAGIDYEYLPALGGLRAKQTGVDPNINGLWQNASFHRYADYAMSAAFEQGLDELIARAQSQRCAIMCAEVLWWRCHRRIVADYLIARGHTVLHLMGNGKISAAKLTLGARAQPGGILTYPA